MICLGIFHTDYVLVMIANIPFLVEYFEKIYFNEPDVWRMSFNGVYKIFRWEFIKIILIRWSKKKGELIFERISKELIPLNYILKIKYKWKFFHLWMNIKLLTLISLNANY